MSEKVKKRTGTREHIVTCKGYRVRFVYQHSAHIGGLGVQFISIDGAQSSGQVMLRIGHRLFMAHWHLERWADNPSRLDKKWQRMVRRRDHERWI